MGIKSYNKLVRDRIPEIIRSKGGVPITSILTDEEYRVRLNEKLMEEVREYLEDQNIEELADIYEVILAILSIQNVSFEQMREIALVKRKERGGFEQKVFLKEVRGEENL